MEKTSELTSISLKNVISTFTVSYTYQFNELEALHGGINANVSIDETAIQNGINNLRVVSTEEGKMNIHADVSDAVVFTTLIDGIAADLSAIYSDLTASTL